MASGSVFTILAPALVGVLIVVGGILVLRLHAVLALALAALVVFTLTPSAPTGGAAGHQTTTASAPGEQMARAAGQTAGKIGFLIVFASVIGEAMRASGAAARIAGAILRLCGPRHAGAGLAAGSFLLGVPVFFDTLFLLLVPLARALRQRSGADYLLYVLAIVAGGTMAHALVPPTPGPLFVAEALGVDILTMMLGGSVVGVVSAAAGLAYARRLNRRMTIPLRPIGGEGEAAAPAQTGTGLSLWLATAPIAVPIGLLAVSSTQAAHPFLPAWLVPISSVVGDKLVALALGTLLALLAVVRRGGSTSDTVTRGVRSGAVVVLVTAAGGAFGESLRQTGMASLFTGEAVGSFWVLPLVFLVSAAVRTAQGSATVAMMTSVSMISGLVASGRLSFHPVYLALAIGCGAKNLAWMNDSGFWVMARTSGMTERETLRTVSVMNVFMALAGFAVVMLGAWLAPLR